MHFKLLPLCLLLLVAEAYPTSSAGMVPRAIERAHRAALKHSRGLARDLRIAFGGPDPPRSVLKKRGQYCLAGSKPSGSNTGDSSASNGNGTANAGSGPGSSSSPSRGGPSRTATGSNPSPTVPTSSPWKLAESHQGNSFFNGWDFWSDADPTHGTVQYVDEGTGRSAGLVSVNSAGNAIMRVDTTPSVPQNRMSIRITTQSQYNGGLFILDAVHMPTGCGTWPAFWTNGPNWPSGGEIDIVEGVNDYTNNQATIHTDPGCRLTTSDASKLAISGTVVGGTDCAAATTGNQGCGVRAASRNSFGAAFNSAGGGVYAMQWDSTGITVWFFQRGSIPPDIDAGVPQPSGWGTALARWPAAGCNPFQFFHDHSVIFDTTLCGDWAGNVWGDSGIPGQEQSCAQRTGFSTCEAFVRASGSSFNEAYWEVRNVKIYQFQG